jgi:glutamyl-tRNA synthetase
VNNTAIQVLLYEALGYPTPTFAHLPMILGADKTRLSKRHGATSVTAYRDMGYLPEAVVNYLVRLGWSHGDQEIFTMAELVRHFGFDHVGATASVFNPEKMAWVNQTWMKSLTPAELGRRALPYYRAAGLDVADDARLAEVARAFQERAKTLVDLVAQSRYFFAPVEMDPKAREKFLGPDSRPVLQAVRDGIAGMQPPDAASLERLFHAVAEKAGLGLGKVAQPVRVALTGGTASPGIYDVVLLLGRDESLRRLDAAL